eukprot:COSAG04_NODE_183_length_21161_cov_4.562693_8_plen_74_part_00
MAPVVHSVEVADSPEAWESAGFTVVDSAVRLGDVLVELKGGSGVRQPVHPGPPAPFSALTGGCCAGRAGLDAT